MSGSAKHLSLDRARCERRLKPVIERVRPLHWQALEMPGSDKQQTEDEMKKTYLLLALSLSVGLALDAGATQLDQHGAKFIAYYGSEQARLLYTQDRGVMNSWPDHVAYVIASVDHNPLPTGSTKYTVWVDGKHVGAQTTPLTLSSYNYAGTFLGSVSASASGVIGSWSRSLTVPSAFAQSGAYFSLFAVLPPNSSGSILGTSVSP